MKREPYAPVVVCPKCRCGVAMQVNVDEIVCQDCKSRFKLKLFKRRLNDGE